MTLVFFKMIFLMHSALPLTIRLSGHPMTYHSCCNSAHRDIITHKNSKLLFVTFTEKCAVKCGVATLKTEVKIKNLTKEI